jgi:hypothetical protein
LELTPIADNGLDEEFMESLRRGNHLRYFYRDDHPNATDEEVEEHVRKVRELSDSVKFKI